jgi:microsomal dipeptidase-like Zn-dependent dipeptidase
VLGILVDATTPADCHEDTWAARHSPREPPSAGASDHPPPPDEREIARRGGLIGIVLFPYTLSNYGTYEVAQERGSLADVARSVRYLVKILGGHEHIGIGSDFSGFIVGPRDMTRLGQVARLRRALMAELGDERMVTDILAGNAARFLAAHWGLG